jgi:outer membrane protein OmpA-like peptidoglycan-associated protein
MRASLPIFASVLILSSCGSPPKPPTVDESRKRPVNVATAVELQTCKSDLQNTRILATETTRLAESASATATRLALQQQAMSSRPSPEVELANAVYTVRFAFGSIQVSVPPRETEALIEHARAATLVMLRARTDGDTETQAESRIARERAIAVRTYLVQSGVDPTRIRMTWQPIGDTVSDNGTPNGRAMNRRVEIELYRLAPQRLAVNSTPSAL